MSTLSFLIDDAFKNIRRNGLMSLAALSTVTIAMAVLGGALFTLYRLDQLIETQPKQFEIIAFLQNETDRDTANEVKTKVEKLSGVDHVSLYTREQAFNEIKLKNPALTEDVPDNPLPDALHIRLSDARQTASLHRQLSDQSVFPEVHTVKDSQETVERLYSIHTMVRNVGGIAAFLLFLATAFVIQNTIRLTVVSRRREIRIMQLVGATSGFIRFPLVLEGIFYGATGAAIASGIVLFVVAQFSGFASKIHSPIFEEMPAPIGPGIVVLVLVMLGAFIGCAGSLLSIRRFLKRV